MNELALGDAPQEVRVEVLITVIVEVRNLAIGIGIATSVANALVCSKASITNVETLIQRAPVLRFEFVEAMKYIRGLGISSSVNRSIWQLLTKLRRAKAMTVEGAIKCASPFGIPASKFMQTALSWRESCLTAVEALEGLKYIADHFSIEICQSPAWSRISDFLDEAARGSYDWVQPNGEVAIPEWADRRRAERLPIKTFGILTRGAMAREVCIKDISENGTWLGLGVEGISGVGMGDKVTVQLECGGIVSGRIVWAKNNKAGIEIMKSYRL